MGKPQESFEEYVDRMNEMATFAATSQGLGIEGQQGKPEDISAIVRGNIYDVLDAELGDEVDEVKKIDIRDLLALELDKFLAKENKPVKALSMLDLVTLGLVDDEDIIKFIKNNGVDVNNKEDEKYIIGVFEEAAEFFDNYIVSRSKKLKINTALRDLNSKEDIFNIFKIAAGKGHKQLIPQACALLRIAAKIDTINRDAVIKLLPEAWEEMEMKAAKYITAPTRTDTGKVSRLKREGVLTFTLEKRLKKREHLIAKLLHKAESGTEDVIDHIGWRFIVDNAVDTLRLIYKIFFDQKTAIFPYSTIRVGRTKNLMLDAEKLIEALNDRKKATTLFEKLSEQIPEEELVSEGEMQDDSNPHSLKGYKAIHIPFDLPLLRLKDGSRGKFPIELQFFDRKSKTKTEKEAPHPAYKGIRQEEVARRVTNGNLLTTYEKQGK